MKPPIKLQSGEEALLTIRRSKASLLAVWIVEVLVIFCLIVLFWVLFKESWEENASTASLMDFLMFVLVCGAVVSGLIGTYVNFKNKMFVTNRRVIYEKVPNLLVHEVKVIDLTEVEDVSFKKEGLFALLFGFGTLRLSTESDETTYLFPYCSTPTDELEIITNLVDKNRKHRRTEAIEGRRDK